MLKSYKAIQVYKVTIYNMVNILVKANELMTKSEHYMKAYEDDYISMEHLLRAAMDIDTIMQQTIENKQDVIKEIIKIRGEIT